MFGKKQKYDEDWECLWEDKLKKHIPEAKIKWFGDIMIDNNQIGMHIHKDTVECFDINYESKLRDYANDVNAINFITKYKVK